MNYLKGIIKNFSTNEVLIIKDNVGYVVITYKINKLISQHSLYTGELYLIPIINNNVLNYFGCHNISDYFITKKLLKIKGIGIYKTLKIFNTYNSDEIANIIEEKKLVKLVL